MPQTGAGIANLVIVTRVVISQEALNAKADVSSRKLKYAILKLSDDYREIVVETTSKDPHYESFYQAVLNSKSVSYEPCLHLTISKHA